MNDCYGYDVGDKVICYIVWNLWCLVWDIDLVCCYGGEEFVILLLYIDFEGVIIVVNIL